MLNEETFLIDPELRKLQLTELEILKDVADLCEKYDLRYYLSGGTLLGAVRHHGFIPRDDVVDIMMPYQDYLEFLKVAQNEFGTRYFVQNYMTDSHDHQAFTKIRKNGTSMIMPNHRRWKIHQGIWIDVFPIVMIKDDKDFKRRKKAISISNFFQMDTFLLDNENEFKSILGFAYPLFRLFLLLPMKFRQQLHSLFLNYAYRECNGGYFSESWGTLTTKYKRQILIGDSMELAFEGASFRVPPKFTEYLKDTYGDYMTLPPMEQRRGH